MSKFKAVNSRDKSFTRARMKRRLRNMESAIQRYLSQLHQADRKEPPADDARIMQYKAAKLREELTRQKSSGSECLRHRTSNSP